MPTTKEEELLHDLWETLLHAQRSYAVWRVFEENRTIGIVGEPAAQEWAMIMNSYPWFINTELHAHIVTMFISIHNFYHGGPQSISYLKALEILAQQKAIKPETLESAQIKLGDLEENYTNIKIVRDRVIAHRDPRDLSERYLSTLKINDSDLKILIDGGFYLLNLVSSEATNNSFGGVLDAVTRDTRRVVQALKIVQKQMQ